MFLMIYARLGLLYFSAGTILQEDSGGGVSPPRLLSADVQTASSQTLTNVAT